MKGKKKIKQMLGKVLEHLSGLSGLFFILFWAAITAALMFIYFIPYNLFGGSVDSARYLLSALAQSQAAIVAIVVTLTLVAVQLASQRYSPRVTDLFLKSWMFWLLLLFYGLSIMYDVLLLNMLNDENVLVFRSWINNALILMAFTFSWLFLYVKHTMDRLKLKSIIEELGKIDVKSFVEKVSQRYSGYPSHSCPRVMPEADDQVLPLVDITKRAIRVDDLTTAREGISKLKEICKGILIEKGCEEKGDAILHHFCCHLEDIGMVALHQKDESTSDEVANALYEFEDIAIKNNLKKVTVEDTLFHIFGSLLPKRRLKNQKGK